jgi:CubicO group peptidase (beta-lactamase class C family)
MSLLVTGTNAQSNRDPVKINIEKIDQYLDSASKQFLFNGVALITEKGKIILNKGYGWKDVKSKMPHDSTSIFQIGSVTKQFTAAVILKLQEQGKLSVNDPIIKYFPNYPNGDKITLYHLLTNTSGIENYTHYLPPFKFLFKKTISQEKIIDIFKDKPLTAKPGTQFHYSSSGYYLLGIVIEKVTGKPYEQVVHENIFTPLHMTNSGFDFRGLSNSSKATGYSVFYKERQTKAWDLDSTVLFSAGAIYSTSGDLYKWIEAVSHQQILKPASWKQALTPYKGSYGLGWAIDSLFGKKYITHCGSTTNFRSFLIYYPDDDISIILLNNITGNLWNTGVDISQILFDQPYPWGSEPEMNVDPRILQQYTGSYVYDDNHTIFVSVKDGKLQLNGTPNTGISNVTFISLSDTRFYNKRLYLGIEFVTDSNGKVTYLKGIREGWYLNWTKVN